MDLGNIWYDIELECLFGGKETHIYLKLAVLADKKKTQHFIHTIPSVVHPSTPSCL